MFRNNNYFFFISSKSNSYFFLIIISFAWKENAKNSKISRTSSEATSGPPDATFKHSWAARILYFSLRRSDDLTIILEPMESRVFVEGRMSRVEGLENDRFFFERVKNIHCEFYRQFSCRNLMFMLLIQSLWVVTLEMYCHNSYF